jgi:succinate dehydrogenase/fumarate reductase flavoprotein subunit
MSKWPREGDKFWWIQLGDEGDIYPEHMNVLQEVYTDTNSKFNMFRTEEQAQKALTKIKKILGRYYDAKPKI